ncbi:MAG: 16S rRNA (cytosine(967)-C(5))-methyltransferase RsmB [Halofilum sp. (in: g-proteobacteria)]
MSSRQRLIPARAGAALVLAAIADGRSLDAALERIRARVADADRALLQELAYGGVRFRLRFDPLLQARLRRPFKPRDRDLEALLLVALYELAAMRTPAHAAVNGAVEAAGALGKGWARGLINGVLRGVLRDPDALVTPADPGVAHGWPAWLAEELAYDWPDAWPDLAASGTARPPMTVRVNLARVTRAAYIERLRAAGIGARPGRAPASLTLESPVAVERLPGFCDGLVSVQDEAAQWASLLLAVPEGGRVLDACAAPGGKTGHLAELRPAPAEIVAVESDPDRAGRLREGLERLSVEAEVITADAADTATWWDGRPFDRILLDAPCSGTGVIRRHPDIKLLRRPADIDALVRTQARLLHALWPLLAPGGMLLYATCSILRRENARQVEAFLRRQDEAVPMPVDPGVGRADGAGWQILPGESGMDGFFYACLGADGAGDMRSGGADR